MGNVKHKRNCRHWRTQELKEFRRYYPFGRKAKPRYRFIKIFGEVCLKCGDFKRRY
jgi:hypothetical protein